MARMLGSHQESDTLEDWVHTFNELVEATDAELEMMFTNLVNNEDEE